MGTVFSALFLSLLTFSKAKRTAVFLRGCCHNFQIIQIRKDGFFAYPCNSRQQPPRSRYWLVVTCSHHLNLTILKWGLPARLPFKAKLKQAIPTCPAVLFFYVHPVTDFFLAPSGTFFINPFSFFSDIDCCIHIPIHPVSTFTDIHSL